MNRRWTPVINYLRKRFTSDTDVVEVEAYLTSQGYDRRQIGEILSLLYSDTVTKHRSAVIDLQTLPMRVQGPHERGRFSPEAWGYLMMLISAGSVTLHEFEHLVERSLVHVDGRIGLAEIRTIAEESGFDSPAMGGDRSQIH
jgi:uncharacterized protein Smg (DUF494 family)